MGWKKVGLERRRPRTDLAHTQRPRLVFAVIKLLHSRLLVEAAVAAVFGEAGVERKKTGGPRVFRIAAIAANLSGTFATTTATQRVREKNAGNKLIFRKK